MAVPPTGKPVGNHPKELPVAKILAMYRDGWSKKAIARYFDVAPSTIRARLEHAETPPPKPL